MKSLAPNIPLYKPENLFSEDSMGREIFKHWIGASWPKFENHFQSMGLSGAAATPLSARADLFSPRLKTHDPSGERADYVEFDLSYRELEKLSYGKGIVALKFEDLLLNEHRSLRHLVGFGSGYYFAQTEMGLYCPICMTDGVGRVLERHGKGKAVELALKHLASRDVNELWQGAMFLTERQGGSDVGVNECVATKVNDRWFLTGDKWFCSNVTADAILALARMPGGPEGTKGLGLFLVLRKHPANNEKSIRIHRIKDKLGVRSMPTGEVTLENTEAFLIGGIGEGFKQMAEMLNMSRLYNSVASLAAMKRALLEARAYGAGRVAFGQKLADLPLWRRTLEDLEAEFWGMYFLVFEAVRALDRADCGDDEARRLVRLIIPVAKGLSGKLAIFTVSECMEAVGGNAYIEESILPRLLRDAQVLPIWEGTTHILSLDSVRAVEKESAHEALQKRILNILNKTSGPYPKETKFVNERLKTTLEHLIHARSLSESEQQIRSRIWLEDVGRTLSLALLLEGAVDIPQLQSSLSSFFNRLTLRQRSIFPVCC